MKKTVTKISAFKANEIKVVEKLSINGGAAHLDYSTQWNEND
ncbi:MAG: hypothetical protein AB8B65_01815 [Kordia sp.]